MKFNTLKTRPRGTTTNLAGGEAFIETPKLELAALMLTNTLGDQFYSPGDAAAARRIPRLRNGMNAAGEGDKPSPAVWFDKKNKHR